MRIGVLGLGKMGGAMARTLARSGLMVQGYDLDKTACSALERDGSASAQDPASLFSASDIVVLSLPNDAAVEAALFSDTGLAAAARLPSLIMDTSTIDPATSRAVAERLLDMGIDYVDCPVSGGPAGAASGQLTIMAGGSESALARARPVLEVLGAKTVICGEAGAGHAVKLINNMLVAANLGLARQALGMGDAFGLNRENLLRALNAGSGRSAATEVNLPRWVLSNAYDSGFTAGLMRKDIKLAANFAGALDRHSVLLDAVSILWMDECAHLPDDADFNRIVTVAEVQEIDA